MKPLLLILIRFYQLCISPLIGSCCRFTPTCSQYTFEAIKKYGAFHGIKLGVKRLLRCHPRSPGGQDDVP